MTNLFLSINAAQTSNETADDATKCALKQINDRDYASKAREEGYKNIIKYGVAFKGKMCYTIVE